MIPAIQTELAWKSGDLMTKNKISRIIWEKILIDYIKYTMRKGWGVTIK